MIEGINRPPTFGDGREHEKGKGVLGRGDVATMSLDALTLDRKSVSPNPGINAAPDGNNAGADISKLPPIPEEE